MTMGGLMRPNRACDKALRSALTFSPTSSRYDTGKFPVLQKAIPKDTRVSAMQEHFRSGPTWIDKFDRQALLSL